MDNVDREYLGKVEILRKQHVSKSYKNLLYNRAWILFIMACIAQQEKIRNGCLICKKEPKIKMKY